MFILRRGARMWSPHHHAAGSADATSADDVAPAEHTRAIDEQRAAAAVSDNVWDVVDDIQAPIRSRAPVDLARLAGPDVPLSGVAEA